MPVVASSRIITGEFEHEDLRHLDAALGAVAQFLHRGAQQSAQLELFDQRVHALAGPQLGPTPCR